MWSTDLPFLRLVTLLLPTRAYAFGSNDDMLQLQSTVAIRREGAATQRGICDSSLIHTDSGADTHVSNRSDGAIDVPIFAGMSRMR